MRKSEAAVLVVPRSEPTAARLIQHLFLGILRVTSLAESSDQRRMLGPVTHCARISPGFTEAKETSDPTPAPNAWLLDSQGPHY